MVDPIFAPSQLPKVAPFSGEERFSGTQFGHHGDLIVSLSRGGKDTIGIAFEVNTNYSCIANW